MVPEIEVERLLADGSVLNEDVRWSAQPSNPRWWQFAAFLDSARETALRLVMSVSTVVPGKYTLLILRGEQVLRRLDVRGSHSNPPGASGTRWIGQTHKHRWTDEFGDKSAYTPQNISITEPFESDEFEETFRAFCNECNVDFRGTWRDPPKQVQQELDL